MLTGYQVIVNFDHFHKNGTGDYVLDLLNRRFTFDGKEEKIFSIFENIQKWFDNEINKNGIDKSKISIAEVNVRVCEPTVDKICIETRKCLFFKKVIETNLYQYKTLINFTLKTDEKDYSKSSVGWIMN